MSVRLPLKNTSRSRNIKVSSRVLPRLMLLPRIVSTSPSLGFIPALLGARKTVLLAVIDTPARCLAEYPRHKG